MFFFDVLFDFVLFMVGDRIFLANVMLFNFVVEEEWI